MQNKTYILKHFDKSIVAFHFTSSALSGSTIEVTHLYEEHNTFFPWALR